MSKSNNKDTRTMPMALLWTYFTPCSSVSIVNFERVIAGWEKSPILVKNRSPNLLTYSSNIACRWAQ